jgi:excisionase family DNA binding protein
MPATISTPLSLNEVAALVGVTRQTITAWVREGRFPRPLRIGRRRRFWDRDAVERAMRSPTK